MRNHEVYKQQIALTSASGAGVIFTRTREPYRCIEALREWAASKRLPFGVWNVKDGWTMDAKGRHPSTSLGDGFRDAYKALCKIRGEGEVKGFESGVYVMHAIHHWVGKHPGITECLRQYVRYFSESQKLRLILISPESEVLIDELVHDIPVVDYHLPDREELKEVFEFVLDSTATQDTPPPNIFTSSQTNTIISSVSGMTQLEAELAFSRAIVENRPSKGSGKEPFDMDFMEFNSTILRLKTDIVKQSEVLELMPSVKMSEVGGLENYKQWIEVVATCLSSEAREAGVDKARGVAVAGPPGTGKTLLGKATATILKRPLVRVDISKCFAGIVGQSEGKARSAIKQLEAMSPVVALIDEIDKALGGAHKGNSDSGVSQRVLGIFLTAMQESKSDIFWILTANRTNNLPSEMMRKGRLDEVFAVLPPNRKEREAIFKIHLRKRKVDPDAVKNLNQAVELSKGYVSAEIESAVKEAKKLSFINKSQITGEDLCKQLRAMRPLCEAFPEDFSQMENWAKNNAKNASLPCEDDDVTEKIKAVRKR
jgi:AAA+ superfamily predicted ATPase